MVSIDRILLIIIALVMLSYPADCTGATNETLVLIDGDGYALANGERRMFYQGYSVVIKGVGAKGEKAWIELLHNDTSVSYGIFEAEDRIIYAKESEIFNMTIDHIYVGSNKDLVFFYVRQYLDPDLPEPVPSLDKTPEPDAPSCNATSTPHGMGDPNFSPGYGVFMTLMVLAILYLNSKRSENG